MVATATALPHSVITTQDCCVLVNLGTERSSRLLCSARAQTETSAPAQKACMNLRGSLNVRDQGTAHNPQEDAKEGSPWPRSPLVALAIAHSVTRPCPALPQCVSLFHYRSICLNYCSFNNNPSTVKQSRTLACNTGIHKLELTYSDEKGLKNMKSLFLKKDFA